MVCRWEAPHLKEWQKKYEKDGLVVLAVNARNDARRRVEKSVKDNDLAVKVLLHGKEVADERYFIPVHPTTFFISSDGLFVDRIRGFLPGSAESMEARLKALLEKEPAPRSEK